jgi:hypothetical protein
MLRLARFSLSFLIYSARRLMLKTDEPPQETNTNTIVAHRPASLTSVL